jgi:hypothetical protein
MKKAWTDFKPRTALFNTVWFSRLGCLRLLFDVTRRKKLTFSQDREDTRMPSSCVTPPAVLCVVTGGWIRQQGLWQAHSVRNRANSRRPQQPFLLHSLAQSDDGRKAETSAFTLYPQYQEAPVRRHTLHILMVYATYSIQSGVSSTVSTKSNNKKCHILTGRLKKKK